LEICFYLIIRIFFIESFWYSSWSGFGSTASYIFSALT
jgi:hypothetical protein